MRIRYGVLFSLMFFLSCNQQIKFDKNKWGEQEDRIYQYRNSMLKDLTSNHKLVGLQYPQLIQLLDTPDFTDKNVWGYSIVTDYGSDIDPVYIKNLEFSFSKDSVITGYHVEEWKKGQAEK
jgi:hypothetical protein